MDKDSRLFFKTFKIAVFLSIFLCLSCSSPKEKKEVVLYQTYCASCHMLPAVEHLPKEIWASKILPDMAARMGIKEGGYNPLSGIAYEEAEAIHATGIYPFKPIMAMEDWELLKNYILRLAPDSLSAAPAGNTSKILAQFTAMPISLDTVPGSIITFLEFDKSDGKLWTGDLFGNLSSYDFAQKNVSSIGQFPSAVVAYTKTEEVSYVTAIGKLDPSEISSGQIFKVRDAGTQSIPEVLHRPVHTLVIDLNNNGNKELVVSEFGNLAGDLSLFIKKDSVNYQKKILLPQPGTIRVLAKDMNKDGKEDLIALTSQGDESITILYQKEDLNFSVDKVLRFPPIYGTSWFELIDFNGDGYQDIVTVNGDNADKSYVQKPYHGLRIHINNGENKFSEKYFYPLNGATRMVAGDFDQDGDMDFAVLSTFPDYKNKPEFSFVYLENKNKEKFDFEVFTIKESGLGRWFLLDAGDVDKDGDVDIILSSFTYVFTPVPDAFTKVWNDKNIDILVLENNLISLKEKE